MKPKKPTQKATKATPKTTTTLHSVSEMNDLLFKAAKLIDIYDSFILHDDNLSPEKSKALFQIFNEAPYQDVMLFRFLLSFIEGELAGSNFNTTDELSDGCYYYDLIHECLND